MQGLIIKCCLLAGWMLLLFGGSLVIEAQAAVDTDVPIASTNPAYIPLPSSDTTEATVAAGVDATSIPDLPDVYNRTTRNRYFEVIAEDYGSMQTVLQMAEEMGTLGSSYYAVSNRIRPILVQLRRSSTVTFQGDYQIRPEVNGEVTIDIKWNGDTEMATVSQALASGFLNRAAIARFGIDATATVPDWLELAFSQLLLTELRSAYIDHLCAHALRVPMLKAAHLLNAQAPFVEGQALVANNAFFLFKYVESELDQDTFRRTLLKLLAGREPLGVLQHALPEILKNRKDLELWWAVGFQHYVRSRQGRFYAMRESRAWIERFAVMTLESAAGPQRLEGVQLWEMRHAPNMHRQVLQRLREIKLEVQKINPVYFNSLLSLGLVFEAIQAGSKEQFYQRYDQFLKDYADAVNLEMGILQLLDY